MPVRIAICDDEAGDCATIERLIHECIKNDFEINTRCFIDGIDLLEEYSHEGQKYDIIFLDVMMPGLSGIQVAAEIRRFDVRVEIVFVSNSDDPVNMGDGYKVSAARYLKKPLAMDELREALGFLYTKLKNAQGRFVIIDTRKYTTKAYYDDIIYIETDDHKVRIYMTSGEIHLFRKRIKDFAAPLLNDSFVHISHGCLVNLKHIDHMENTTVVMGRNIRLTAAKAYFGDLRKRYLHYAKRELNVTW